MGTRTSNYRQGTGGVMWLDFMIMKNVILAGMIITIQYPAASFAAGLKRAGHNVAFTGIPVNHVTEEHPSFSGDAHTHKLSSTQEKSTVFSRTRFQTTKRIPFPTTTIRPLPSETTDIQTSRKQSTDTIIPSMSTVVPDIQTSQIDLTFPPMSTVGEETAATTKITTKSTTTTTATSTRTTSKTTTSTTTSTTMTTTITTTKTITTKTTTTTATTTTATTTTKTATTTITTTTKDEPTINKGTTLPSLSTVATGFQTTDEQSSHFFTSKSSIGSTNSVTWHKSTLQPLSTGDTEFSIIEEISSLPLSTTKKETTISPLSTVVTGFPTYDEKSSLSLSSKFTTTESTTKKSVSEAEKEKEEAEKAKAAKVEAREEAEETKAAAEEASSTTSLVNTKINELIGISTTEAGSRNIQDQNGARHKRDVTSYSTTISYETPESCATFIEMVSAMTKAIADEKYSKATNIGTALIFVDSDAVSCSSDEITSLEEQKTEVVAVQNELSAAISGLENEISELESEITTLEETISNLEEFIESKNQTTFPPTAKTHTISDTFGHTISTIQDESTLRALSTKHSTIEHVSSIRPTSSATQDGSTYQPLSTTMASTITLPSLESTIPAPDCCSKKSVGLITYTLFSTSGDDWEIEDTGCNNTCIYLKDGWDPDFKFCFKPGFKDSKCLAL